MRNKIITEDRGQWIGDKWLYPESWGWNINMSSTLTELIHIAGKYVDAWASDLFIFWKYNIENKEIMQNKEWNKTWYIGFRECGVDWSDKPWKDEENKVFINEDNNSYYYRRIVKLEIAPDEQWYESIKMTLTEVA